MRIIRLLLLLPILFVRPVAAQDVMAAVRANAWADAQAMAGQHPDPVAGKLVSWFRLMAPNGGGLAEIAAFQADSPDWPLPGNLARRRDEALVNEADDIVVLAQCDKSRGALAAAQMRCAEAFTKAGRGPDATALVRQAWAEGTFDAAAETKFLLRWSGALRREDTLRRFDRLAWSEPNTAGRLLVRMEPGDRKIGETRLALRRDEGEARGKYAGLTEAQRNEPTMFLEAARWLRRGGQEDAALAMWLASGTAAEKAAPKDRLSAFWDERNLMARRRLRVADAEGAYKLADGHGQTGAEQIADAEFLAGFIALRRLGNRAEAERHFLTLAGLSKSAITQGRAQYWLARAAASPAEAMAHYKLSAAYPHTFYGQLSALALDPSPLALAAKLAVKPVPADGGRVLDLAGRELARAAAILVGWGEPRRAAAFLLRLDDISPDPDVRDMTARLAGGLGLPDVAVALARRAGRDGLVPLGTGWPIAAVIPDDAAVEPALALAVIRQESSFDSGTTSPAGARGLMQLMPATAAQVGKKIGVAAPPASLTADPALNVRLGTTYLGDLMAQFENATPLAVAGYNAGPGRTVEWLGANGDPRRKAIDGIDWIELIPFAETRNYVQRVIENEMIYRAQLGVAAPHPLAAWLP